MGQWHNPSNSKGRRVKRKSGKGRKPANRIDRSDPLIPLNGSKENSSLLILIQSLISQSNKTRMCDEKKIRRGKKSDFFLTILQAFETDQCLSQFFLTHWLIRYFSRSQLRVFTNPRATLSLSSFLFGPSFMIAPRRYRSIFWSWEALALSSLTCRFHLTKRSSWCLAFEENEAW